VVEDAHRPLDRLQQPRRPAAHRASMRGMPVDPEALQQIARTIRKDR
jgi:hypothetical protein